MRNNLKNPASRMRVPGQPPPPKHGGQAVKPAKVDPAESAFRNYPQDADGRPIIDDDPLKMLFASSGVQVVGNPEDSMPEEIANFISKNNFASRYFCVVLREIPEGGDEETKSHHRTLKTFTRTIPTFEYIARHYGPGKYVFQVSWREHDGETGKTKENFEEIPFEISKKLEYEHLEFLRQRKIESAKLQNEEIARIRMDSKLNESMMGISGPADQKPIDPKENAKAYISEIAQAAELLGFKRNEGSGFSMEKVMPFLPMVATAVGAVMKLVTESQNSAKEQMNNLLMMMLTQSKESNQQLLEVAKIQNGQGSGMALVNEFKQMVMGAIDMKEMINGNKETVADKIFGMVETVLPQILTLAAQSQQQRNMNPAYNMAKAFMATDPTMKQLNDPEVLRDFIRKSDSHYGWRQTDQILNVAGWERPVTCPRNEDEEMPADQRGESIMNADVVEGA